jgi:hypothetical protein
MSSILIVGYTFNVFSDMDDEAADKTLRDLKTLKVEERLRAFAAQISSELGLDVEVVVDEVEETAPPTATS